MAPSVLSMGMCVNGQKWAYMFSIIKKVPEQLI